MPSKHPTLWTSEKSMKFSENLKNPWDWSASKRAPEREGEEEGMAETLTVGSVEPSEMEPVDVETLRSRLKELSEARIASHPIDLDANKVIEDWCLDLQGRLKEMESHEDDILNLETGDLEAYLENLKKEVSVTEDVNVKMSAEIDALSRTFAEETAFLDGELKALASSLEFIDSQGLHCVQTGAENGRPFSRYEYPMRVSEDYKFEIWELDQRIEKSKLNLNDLQELDYAFRSVEVIGQLEDLLSDTQVIEFEGNSIRLSLKTPISLSDNFHLRHKLEFLTEPLVLDHELLIEVDSNMNLKNMEIFPGDISLDEIVNAAKSSRHHLTPIFGSILGWLVRQVQQRIFFCSLRRLAVEDAKRSRHTFEYSDRDDTVTAHLVGGIDAFIKISQGWPVSGSALKLLSVKNTDVHAKSISLGFLCKVKELVNSLDVQKRQNLPCFVDEIEEILIRETQLELHSDDSTA